MDAARSQNLKKLLDAVPAGYLVDAAWLVSQGIAYESFRDYVKRGWLDRITRGVFRRPGTSARNRIASASAAGAFRGPGGPAIPLSRPRGPTCRAAARA